MTRAHQQKNVQPIEIDGNNHIVGCWSVFCKYLFIRVGSPTKCTRPWTMKIMNKLTLLDRMRHQLNPMHVYCRLTELGISPNHAKGLCKMYEAIFYKSIFGRWVIEPFLKVASLWAHANIYSRQSQHHFLPERGAQFHLNCRRDIAQERRARRGGEAGPAGKKDWDAVATATDTIDVLLERTLAVIGRAFCVYW